MNYKKMLKIFADSEDISKSVTVPANIEDTVLCDDEINKVISYLLYLKEQYFDDIPLSDDLCKQFVWNIPKQVYDMSCRCCEYSIDDRLNPLFYLYIYCATDPRQAIIKMLDVMDVDLEIISKDVDILMDDWT